jgi:tRNA threonylcarbamoyladenosine biosynthesis protein TsaB
MRRVTEIGEAGFSAMEKPHRIGESHEGGPGNAPMLLAIDTCGSVGGVALGRVEELDRPPSQNGEMELRPGHFRELAGKRFAESLIATIAEMLDAAGATLAQLDGIVVAHGPGSFTGIRIGVSAAKGFAEALGIPLIAVSRLELLARQSPSDAAAGALDAGRGEFYAGVHRRTGRRESVREAEILVTREQLARLAADSEWTIVVCEQQVFSALEGQRVELAAAPTAVDALKIGAERFRLGALDDVATLDANYLRRSETEMLARIAEHAAMRAAEAAERR